VSRTESAALALAGHFEMTPADVRGDLERAQGVDFEQTRLYLSVFALADGVQKRRVPRAVVPRIVLQTLKTTRRLTTENYAARAAERHRACLGQL